MYISRKIGTLIKKILKDNKSILLLGPRQTGKTTLAHEFPIQQEISFLQASTRLKYERNPDTLIQEIEGNYEHPPLILVDEIQKVPQVMDAIQWLIDKKKAQFILTGSSARKLRRGKTINLAPGRLVSLRVDPLTLEEWTPHSIEQILLFGTLPEIALMSSETKELILRTYVETYLETEVRAEALVKNMGVFSRFLELAAIESGQIISFRSIAHDLGITHTTVSSYYEILEDCLIVEKILPLTKAKNRRKILKKPRYLFFDLGMRRLSANEGQKLLPERKGQIFEEFVGLQLLQMMRYKNPSFRLKFWKDSNGPEIDWIIETPEQYVPIEVKWTENPDHKSIKHLKTFLNEYPESKLGYVISRVSKKRKLSENIIALPWQELPEIFMKI